MNDFEDFRREYHWSMTAVWLCISVTVMTTGWPRWIVASMALLNASACLLKARRLGHKTAAS